LEIGFAANVASGRLVQHSALKELKTFFLQCLVL
jgi:hypothetical protein